MIIDSSGVVVTPMNLLVPVRSVFHPQKWGERTAPFLLPSAYYLKPISESLKIRKNIVLIYTFNAIFD